MREFTAAEMIRWLEGLAMEHGGGSSWTEDDDAMARQIAEHLREMHED